ncbi:putative quinol monooxygenase [Rhodococcus sp. NPDC057529]|uniref:putative quinol monooxygenase n=1 Tax=Rhodococcus sp. NPDC057529 TaxID=3346158 RepID=UPI00366B77D5
MITCTARMRFRPETVDTALALFTDVIPATRAEPGCDFYEFYRDIEDPLVIMSVQRWDDLEALIWHSTTPQGRRVGEEMPALTTETADIRVHVGARVLEWPLSDERKKELIGR